MSNPCDVRDALSNQMARGVGCLDIMESCPVYNIVRVYELGPGRILTGLSKRAGAGCVSKNTDKVANIQNVLREIAELIMWKC